MHANQACTQRNDIGTAPDDCRRRALCSHPQSVKSHLATCLAATQAWRQARLTFDQRHKSISGFRIWSIQPIQAHHFLMQTAQQQCWADFVGLNALRAQLCNKLPGSSLSAILLAVPRELHSSPLLQEGTAVYRFAFWVALTIASLLSSDQILAQTAVAEPPAVDAPTVKEAAKTKQADNADTDRKSSDAEPLYLRIHKSETGKPLAMQTAIVRYQGKPESKYAGKIVDLIGVVHIGQREYYKDLNNRLSKYESVLYELVAPDGTRIRPEDLQKRRSLLASMQTGMKDMLNLEYQLELIDYMAENFKHADMSPEEFTKDLTRRGDSIWKMGARMMGAGLASQASTGGDMGMLLAFFSNDRSRRMKQTMAKQLVDIEVVTAGMDDKNGENTLIKGRNVKAFQVLREQLDAGKSNVSVFYGAGHLPDMAERLEKDFQMMSTGETIWLDAWDLTRN